MPPTVAPIVEEPVTRDRTSFKRGDLVIHPKKPEWGSGLVHNAAALTHEGKPAQRLTIDFANKGRTVINTGIVKLDRDPRQPPEVKRLSPRNTPQELVEPGRGGLSEAEVSSEPRSSSNGKAAANDDSGWLDTLEKQAGKRNDDVFSRMPDAVTDAFTSLDQRLDAVLQTFRWSTEARSIFEWAVAQTGLDDPMTTYTRHELEDGFHRFMRERDQQLRDLVRQLKRNNQQTMLHHKVQQLSNKEARAALKRAIKS